MKTGKPPLRKKTAAPDLEKLDQFAAQSVEPIAPVVTKPEEFLPWEDPSVRDDVIKGMGVPLSERYLLKLRFIAENTRWSQRKFCRNSLEDAIDREIAKILDGMRK